MPSLPPSRSARRLVAVALIAALLVNYPVLALVEELAAWSGLPLVPVWLVLVWAGLIVAVRALVRYPSEPAPTR
jgi:hypothetical protein